ncbi:hypothetical protein [uncultured Campylobacter sp.]|uniref:hypothetical protein n=1 Tax=uncultured Campylobacter sp. TaxID=218934 RepID=UPI00260A2288|nr:hypothetical protein [uncultured Campylobacter sp.]
MQKAIINAVLPVHMKVLEHISYNRYTLLLNSRKISTKSLIELELNAEYLAEIYEGKGGVLSFKNLSKKPNIIKYDDGLNLLLNFLEGNVNFKDFVLKKLIESENSLEFKIYKEMLFALAENIYHIPFVYEDKTCLFQLRKSALQTELYLYFSVFGSLKFIFDDKGLSLYTPFAKVAAFLSPRLKCEIYEDKNLKALFEFKRLLDFKG